jgi:hypothetical protein
MFGNVAWELKIDIGIRKEYRSKLDARAICLRTGGPDDLKREYGPNVGAK